MPCTAKKFEIGREDENGAGVPDVDIAITTRELGRMIERASIRFTDLPDEEFDMPLGLGSGAAVIFGATGGVMEAALRTAVEKLTGEELAKLDFTDVRGIEGIKEAVYNVAGMDVKVAVVSGLKNAKELLKKVKSGEAEYHFIEIMGCPGGCVNGGGRSSRDMYAIPWIFVQSVRKYFITWIKRTKSVNHMRIRQSLNYMIRIWVNRAAIKHMSCYIPLM